MTTPPSALPILFESASFVVVDKPSGVLSVPGIGPEKQDCVISRVRTAFPHALGPMMVHRLDMDTSGVLVVALTVEAQRALSREFESRRVDKRYVALLDGTVAPDSGVISLPLRLDVDRRPYQIVDFVHGKEAVTHFEVLTRTQGSTRVRFEPITGRTHQLRVHSATPPLAYEADAARRPDQSPGGLGCPIAGDPLYGTRAQGARLALHAEWMAFNDPTSGERLEFRSASPF